MAKRIERMIRERGVCPCLSHVIPQKHHLFRAQFRKRLEELQISKVEIKWKNKDGEIRSTCIPIDSVVYLCPSCHKENHPENINYHLNQLVVKKLEELK